jgi:hypothetical protein
MTLHRKRQFFGCNTSAIVEHSHQRHTARLDVDVDRPRAGIERVLHQFLDE